MSRRETEDGRRADIYERITARIVADLEKGVRPWIQPWGAAHAQGRITRPLRHSGEPYTGMNVLLLWSEAVARGFASPIWMTFRQASELGGHVRKGETGAPVIYASRFMKDEVDAQGDPVERIAHADRFFAHTGAITRHGGREAFYSPSTDHIQMPPFETFRDAASYVAVLSHESIHWTAHASRVGRDLSRYAKDRSERAREELVAEIGSALLCADLGIVPELEPRPDHAAYLASWLTVLANDKRAIFAAAAHAQRAVAFLHALQPQSDDAREAA